MPEFVTHIQRAFAPVLKPFAWMYGSIMRFRARLYRLGMLPSWGAPVLTVSVGNIGWGGSGKTPVADWLLGWAEQRGLKAALLTRGYRAKPPVLPYQVKPGALAEEAGDEPLMLARSHERAAVMVDPKRTRAGKAVMKDYRPDMVVLDDGFQHMAVKRHVNLVLLKPEDVLDGWNKVIPAGSWREPETALERADAFMIKTSAVGFAKLRPYLERRLESLGKPIFSFRIMPSGVRRVVSGESARDFNGGQYVLVSGVGDPAQVEGTALAYFGYPPLKHFTYKDHHAYTKADVLDISEQARKLGCKAVLCTPKDAVKLGEFCTDEFWEFDLRLEFGPSTMKKGTTFETWWNRKYELYEVRRKERAAAARKTARKDAGHGRK